MHEFSCIQKLSARSSAFKPNNFLMKKLKDRKEDNKAVYTLAIIIGALSLTYLPTVISHRLRVFR